MMHIISIIRICTYMDSAYVVHHLYTRVFFHSSSSMKVGCSMALVELICNRIWQHFQQNIMWAFSGGEVNWTDDITQDIHEQQLMIKFDCLKRQVGFQIRALILHVLGFGIVAITGLILYEI